MLRRMCRKDFIGPIGLTRLMGIAALTAALAVAGTPLPTSAATSPARAEAMQKLSFMSGVWRGAASGVERDGTRYEVTQTERIGPMLDGDILVIEGRGYKADGSVGFNAFAVISWDERGNKYDFRSYAAGYSGTFELKLTQDGYTWEVPAGPGAVVRYTAKIQDNKWHEVGEYIAEGAEPSRTFEMNLVRAGDTDWPSADAVPMK